MIIIKRGILPAEREWKGTCYTCKSVIEAKQSELNQIENDQRDGEWGKAKCPVCNSLMNFYPKKD